MKNDRKKITFDWKYGLYANIYFMSLIPAMFFVKNTTVLILSIVSLVLLFFLLHLFEKKHDNYNAKNRIYFKPVSITCLVIFIIGELALISNYQTSQNLPLLFSYAIICSFIKDGFSSEKL